MNFDLSEEQELFCTTVERFGAPMDVEARRKLRLSDGGYDRARWQELAELGLIALAADENSGGMGGSMIDLALIGEAIGKANTPDPWIENGVLPARILSEAGSNEACEAVLSGSRIAAIAGAERHQRYNLANPQTTASATGEGVSIHGEKTAVLGGAMADDLIISAAMDGNVAWFLVPVDSSGVERRNYRLADGSMACEVRLSDASAIRLNVSDEQMTAVISDIRLISAAEMLGLAQRLFDDTLVYVKEREQFGVPIGSFQALQHRLVDCYAKIEQARSMLYRAAMEDRSDSAGWARSCAGAKTFISEQADHVAREAVQMHGGMGVTEELAIGHAMKRAMVLAKLFGDADAMLAEYAEAA